MLCLYVFVYILLCIEIYTSISLVISLYVYDRYVVKDTVNELVTEAEIELLQRFGIDNKDGFFDKTEFIVLCAIRINILTPSIVQYVVQRFDELDESGTGRLCYAAAFKKYRSLIPSLLHPSPRARHPLRSQSVMTPRNRGKDSPAPHTSTSFSIPSSPLSPVGPGRSKATSHPRTPTATLPTTLRKSSSFEIKPDLTGNLRTLSSDPLSLTIHTSSPMTTAATATNSHKITPLSKTRSPSFFSNVMHSVGANLSMYKRRHDFFDIPAEPEKSAPAESESKKRASGDSELLQTNYSICDFIWILKYWDSFYRLPFIVGVVWLGVGTVYYAISDGFGWCLGFYMAVSNTFY